MFKYIGIFLLSLMLVGCAGKAKFDVRTQTVAYKDLSNIECDITSQNSINNAMSIIIEKYNRIDGLVNNAYPRTTDWGNKFEDIKLES